MLGKPAHPLDSLLPLVRKIRAEKIPGDFIELGVLAGQTLIPLAFIAETLGKRCYGIDSFRGMSKPGERDGAVGRKLYPEGRFDQGGRELIDCRVSIAGLVNTEIFEGFIPDVLEKVPLPGPIALAHLDLDIYKPTLEALEWVWPRMSRGGFIAVHDYCPKNLGMLARGAVEDFLSKHSCRQVQVSRLTAWFRKD